MILTLLWLRHWRNVLSHIIGDLVLSHIIGNLEADQAPGAVQVGLLLWISPVLQSQPSCMCQICLYARVPHDVNMTAGSNQDNNLFSCIVTENKNLILDCEAKVLPFRFSSVPQSCPNSLWPHGLQHARPPCSTPTPRVYSNSCPESVMPHNHLIVCCPLLLPPSIFPSIRVFSNESVLHIRWPKYWYNQSFWGLFRTDFL